MKTNRLFLLFIAACVSILSTVALAANENGTIPNGTVIILGPKGSVNPIKRPKTPSRQIVECMYDSGVMTIDFAIPEGSTDTRLVTSFRILGYKKLVP